MRLFDAEGRAALLTVYSLRGQPRLQGAPPAEAALFVTFTCASPVAAARLRILFGFTPAESRLAQHLMQDGSLREIGERLHLSRETLRSQLRSMFAKTGTHRQAEQVGRLFGSVSVAPV